jgi:hypothetical protein
MMTQESQEINYAISGEKDIIRFTFQHTGIDLKNEEHLEYADILARLMATHLTAKTQGVAPENVDIEVNKPVLPVVLSHNEINTFLKEQFYESWMDDDDWKMFLDELKKHSGASIQSLSKDLQVGLENGHSIENQFDLVRAVLKNSR